MIFPIVAMSIAVIAFIVWIFTDSRRKKKKKKK